MSIAHPEVLERLRREGLPSSLTPPPPVDPSLIPTDSWPRGTYTGGVDPTIVHGGPVPPEMIPRIDTWPTSLPRGRTNQAPRPEGFQRAVTGLADYITGNKWDFDQRGRGVPNHWSEQQRRQWNAPDDLTVTQGAEQGVRRGGGLDQLRSEGLLQPMGGSSKPGILNRIGDFLGGLGGGVVPGSPDAPADMQGTQMVRDPRTGEWVHPNVLKHWSRQ